MLHRMGVIVAGLALVIGTAASAQQIYSGPLVTGTVARIDTDANVIVLSDGQMIQTVPGTVVLDNNAPIAVSELTPGAVVTIRNGRLVTWQNDRYVAADASPAPESTVVAAPPAATAVTVPTGQAYTGVVRRIDRPFGVIVLDNGTVIHTNPDTVILIDNRLVDLSAVPLGSSVVVYPEGPGASVMGSASVPTYATGLYSLTESQVQAP
jgi:hypothetical protein